MKTKYDVIVIGAGLIGMLFARTIAALGIKVAIIDKKSPKEIIHSADNGKNIAFIGPGLGGGPFGGGVGVGLRKTDTDLLKMFNKAIDEARADGSLAKHFSKWFGKDISM